MAALPADTNRLRSRPSSVLPGVRRIPAHIHQVGAGELAVSLGGLAVGSSRTPSVSLTGPEPAGSPDLSRLAVPPDFVTAAFRPPRRLPAQAAASFTGPPRRSSGAGLAPPLETAAPRGARIADTSVCASDLVTAAGQPVRGPAGGCGVAGQTVGCRGARRGRVGTVLAVTGTLSAASPPDADPARNARPGRLALSGTGLVPRGRGAGSGGVAGASRRRGCPAWTTSDRPSTRPWARCWWPRPGWTGWAPWLAPGDFRDPLGREVYGLLLAMRARSAVIDVVRDDLADLARMAK